MAAIIIEPQLGEGGFVPAPVEFLRELRRLCTAHGIVLIVDEIQTGFGRTGRMFAYEHYGIEPDLVTLAKSLGGGLPLSAVVGKAAIMDAPAVGGLGGTYAGNPVACAAALAVLDVFEDEHVLEQARAPGRDDSRGAARPSRPVTRRWATCAVWARCRRSRSCSPADRAPDSAERPAHRRPGAVARAAAAQVGHLQERDSPAAAADHAARRAPARPRRAGRRLRRGVRMSPTFDVQNPATGARVESVPNAGVAEARVAARRSIDAFPGWRDRTAYERSKILRGVERPASCRTRPAWPA